MSNLNDLALSTELTIPSGPMSGNDSVIVPKVTYDSLVMTVARARTKLNQMRGFTTEAAPKDRDAYVKVLEWLLGDVRL